MQSQPSTYVLPAALAHAANLFERLLSVINHCKPAMDEILKLIIAAVVVILKYRALSYKLAALDMYFSKCHFE